MLMELTNEKSTRNVPIDIAVSVVKSPSCSGSVPLNELGSK
jgi:hypothetical protein